MSSKENDLVARLAHELQAPLISIELRLNELSTAASNAKTAAISSECLEQVRHLQAILTNALALGNPPRPSENDPCTTVVAELFTAMGTRFRPLSDKTSVRLEIEDTAGVPDVPAPRNVLERILSALVDNAIKFSPAGDVVRLRAFVDAPTATIILEVSDRGCGVEESIRARVFEPFFRANREIPGSGLGLAIARELARAHGGTIELEPRPERGLRSLVSFPQQ